MHRAPTWKVQCCSCFRPVKVSAEADSLQKVKVSKKRRVSPLFTASAQILWFNFLLQSLLSVSPTFGKGQRPGSHWGASEGRMLGFFLANNFGCCPKCDITTSKHQLNIKSIPFYIMQQEDTVPPLWPMRSDMRTAARQSITFRAHAETDRVHVLAVWTPPTSSATTRGQSIYIW